MALDSKTAERVLQHIDPSELAQLACDLVNRRSPTGHETELAEYPQLDVILDGRLGMIFLQRPLSEDEIDVLLDKGHSPILRRDFLRRAPLTEDDVLEIDMRKSSR